MPRLPREVSVHLFRRSRGSVQFLMLRRTPNRGGFWQGVSGAPLPGETHARAAVREVREETGFDVSETLFALDVTYAYTLRPELAERWAELYGPGIESIVVTAFGAEAPPDVEPVLDPLEHDVFRWFSYDEARALLAWPIEEDALHGRREALRVLASRLGAI